MKIAINGFGRIGRVLLKTALQRGVEIAVINDLADAKVLAHLFKYDSVHGLLDNQIKVVADGFSVDGQNVRVISFDNPAQAPWKELGIDLVIECTGKFATREQAQLHLNAGAKQVVVSAPVADRRVPMVVMGVNDGVIDFASPILSNASCTTNNVAPMVKILDDNWGVEEGYITTIHSMTGDQNLHDAPHNDLRRARAAASSIIPTTTGAAKATTHIFPHLAHKLGGAGIRVPVLNGSLTDFTCILKTKPTTTAINHAFAQAASATFKNIVQYTEDPIVSVDIINNPHSCIFDAQLTSIVGDLVKVVGWYDNESGYANRLVDVIERINRTKA